AGWLPHAGSRSLSAGALRVVVFPAGHEDSEEFASDEGIAGRLGRLAVSPPWGRTRPVRHRPHDRPVDRLPRPHRPPGPPSLRPALPLAPLRPAARLRPTGPAARGCSPPALA